MGGVGSGKSTLMDILGADWVTRYRRHHARRLILDSKPRYRAQYHVRGMSARRRYSKWAHGNPVAGSILIEDPEDLELAFNTEISQGVKANTVIIQGESSADIPRLIKAAGLFLRSSRANRPQLLQVDETLDFFHSNGATRGGDDAIIRAARAGRERGTAALYGAQRTKGVPPTLMEEMERLYAFRIDFKSDAKQLQAMGAPEFDMPTRKREFFYWYKESYDRIYGPYTLALD